MDFFLDIAWLIPTLPLLGAFFIAAFMKRLKEPLAGHVGSLVMGVALVIAAGGLLAAVGGAEPHGPAPLHDTAAAESGAESHESAEAAEGEHGAQAPAPYGTVGAQPLRYWAIDPWGVLGGHGIRMGLQVDNLAAAVLFMVTLVAFCVQFYSISYMHGDKRYVKYFAAVNLFTTGMLIAVMADNLFVLLVGWEIMGLCSYLLIGHWFEQTGPQLASMKAFLTTRVGDVFMMVGVGYMYFLTGTLNLNEIAAKLPEVNPAALMVAALLLFGGPIGKSAQFPLHTWLPDAMAGPTPGSALIHAATMVAVGVYFVARTFTIFASAPAEVLGVIALVGAFTSIFAASIATVRTDIKQVLAYSTVSQLGYMTMALGVGSMSAGIFHLLTHGFFKALLFLASGSVIHAVHTQEMHQMGGLARKLPVTYWTWIVGFFALAGIPGFSGFFSKDELLLAAYNWHAPASWPAFVSYLPFILGIGTAFLTAYYMTRATQLTFWGKPRDHHAYEHAHESDRFMTIPLVLLAVFAFLGGYPWAAILGVHWWPGFVGHPLQSEAHNGALLVTGIATLMALGGVTLGLWLYRWSPMSRRVAAIRSLQPLYTVLRNKYYVDELYHVVFIRGSAALANLAAKFDQYVIDGIVNAVGAVGQGLSTVSGWFDLTWVDGIVNGMGALAVGSGRQLRKLSTGYAQSYMMTFAVVVVFGAVAAWFIFSGMGG